MSVLQEFRSFAVKGNVVDMAVGIIIGAAFGKIVSSLVGDVVMPPLGMLIGGVDFSELALVLRAGAGEAQPVLLRYGKFIQSVVDFVVIAAAIFVAVKTVNSMKRSEQTQSSPPTPSAETLLLSEIRDLLRKPR